MQRVPVLAAASGPSVNSIIKHALCCCISIAAQPVSLFACDSPPPAWLAPAAGKLAGLDKKLSRSLEEEVAAGSASPSSLSKSPVGPLQESSSRKTLVYLILTLNHIYPDYDFSLLRAHHFRKEDGVSAVEELIDAHLVEASKVRAAPARRAADRWHAPPCNLPGWHAPTRSPGIRWLAQRAVLSLLVLERRRPWVGRPRWQCPRKQGFCASCKLARRPCWLPGQVWETTPGFGEEPLLDNLWSSIDEAICLKECDVYRWGACPALPHISSRSCSLPLVAF